MAEGGENKTGAQTTHSIESDCIFDFYCEFCRDENKNVEAEGFCVDCKEYLCGVCYKAHTRNRQMRYHQLLDKETMPKDQPLSSDRVSKAITTKCRVHAGELVKYYCGTHDVLGCEKCLYESHRRCLEVESILDYSENILDSQEYTDLIQTLQSIDKKSRDLIAKACAHITKTRNCHSEVVESIKLLRENINEILDKLEQDSVTEAGVLVSEEEKNMATISSTCSTVTESTETRLAEFQSLQSTRRVCQVYISMKENSEHIKTLQDKIHQTESAFVVTTFKFEPNRVFQDFVKSLPTLGNISKEVQKIIERQQTEVNKLIPVKSLPTCGDISSEVQRATKRHQAETNIPDSFKTIFTWGNFT